MLKFASILAFAILLIAVAIFNGTVNHNASAVKTFDLNHSLFVQLQPFPVQVEEQTHFTLSLSENTRLKTIAIQEAWIEGVNMFMGRTSVYIEASEQENVVQGWFFLGSCSEPQMQWRLYIRLENESGEEETLHFDFFTGQL